jgi:hypothetical protein
VLLASASKLLGASNQVALAAVGVAAIIMVVVHVVLGAHRRRAAQKPLLDVESPS